LEGAAVTGAVTGTALTASRPLLLSVDGSSLMKRTVVLEDVAVKAVENGFHICVVLPIPSELVADRTWVPLICALTVLVVPKTPLGS